MRINTFDFGVGVSLCDNIQFGISSIALRWQSTLWKISGRGGARGPRSGWNRHRFEMDFG